MGSFNEGQRCGEDFLALASAQQSESLKMAIIDNDIIKISSLIEEVLEEVVDDNVYDSLWLEGLKRAMKFSTKGKKDMGTDRGVEILVRWADKVGVVTLRDKVKEVIGQKDYTNLFDQFKEIVESCDEIYSQIPKEDGENASISKEVGEAFEAYLMEIGKIAFHDALPTNEAVYFAELERENAYGDEDEDEDAAGDFGEDDEADNAMSLINDMTDHFIPHVLKPFLRKTNTFLKVIGKE